MSHKVWKGLINPLHMDICIDFARAVNDLQHTSTE